MRRLLYAIALMALLAASSARAAERVDLLLVLAADVSRSVDPIKFQLQREGYAAAIAVVLITATITTNRIITFRIFFLPSNVLHERIPRHPRT